MSYGMMILMFGAPGVGKGTQAAMLATRKNIPHLSTGDAFRLAIAEGTQLGKTAKEFVESGKLVPDEIVTGIVKAALNAPKFADSCILDGYPRTQLQAVALKGMLAEQNRSIYMVVNIVVPEEVIVNRMLERGRKDDTREVIADRLQIYMRETAPLLEFYEKEGVLHIVDGNATMEEVYERITHLFE